MRAFQARVRRAAMKAKLERGCEKCGYNANADALQFDHVVPRRDGKKWVGPKTMTALARLLEDPNIQVLCANCHAIKSNLERRAG